MKLFLAFLGLVMVYLLQRFDALAWICSCSMGSNTHFVVNKSLRLLANDLLMLWMIHLWFQSVKITRLALWVQLIDAMVLLPFYFLLKLSLEGDSEISSPLLSQLHRLIINPTLMILIFPAIYFQRIMKTSQQVD